MTRRRSTDPQDSLTVTEAVRRFSDVVNQAHYEGRRFTLTRGGKPVAEIGPARSPTGTAGALAAAWRERPRLGRAAAAAFARDLVRARRGVAPARPPAWPGESDG
jgi:antitoxin (DNA-binding transcriptional repressor) of toxin-antitoxin stability system